MQQFFIYYPDVRLQFNTFRALSRPSSGAQWLQWQPLVLPSYRGDNRHIKFRRRGIIQKKTYNIQRKVKVWHQEYLIVCLLTTWSRLVLEKLTGFLLVKKFLAFYGTRRFITAFTVARQLSIFRTSSIQSIPPHPTSWSSILILYSIITIIKSNTSKTIIVIQIKSVKNMATEGGPQTQFRLYTPQRTL
jgi:hypothetical protein